MSDIRKLPTDWKETMWNLYAQGASDAEIMVGFDMTRGLFEDLYADSLGSEFQEAVEYGRLLAQAWWEKQGRVALRERGFQAQLWRINMQVRFAAWGDNTGREESIETPETVNRKLKARLADLESTQAES